MPYDTNFVSSRAASGVTRCMRTPQRAGDAARRRVRHAAVRRARGSHFVHTDNLFIDLVRF